jgi:signal transduction histidine kinase
MIRVILQAVDIQSALKEITAIARPVFIFDNIVLYQQNDDHSLEPFYARSIGRGRSMEADMAWGEVIAQSVLTRKDLVIRKEEISPRIYSGDKSRLNTRLYLGIPLGIKSEIRGTLIFIRYGGPDYSTDQVDLARLIAEQVEHLLEKQGLINQIADLEAKRRLDHLQEEFVATVSHDLRSPLGFIKGYTTTLLRDDIEWDQQSNNEFLSIIDEEADRLLLLIENLLDSSRLQTGTLPLEFQDVDIETFVKDYAHRVQMSDHNLVIKLDFETPIKQIKIDPSRMIQVFDNLISNVIKYAVGSPIIISMKQDPEFVHISFLDEGPGIPEDQLEKIFQKFYRLPNYRDRARGSGLGLFICKEIIQAHHGQIYAESSLGSGAKFNILIPRKMPSNLNDPLVRRL